MSIGRICWRWCRTCSFRGAGEPVRNAGFELAHMIRESVPDVPIVLQSSRTEYMARAHGRGFAFLQKALANVFARFPAAADEQCAFGDFVFRMPDGTEVARASDMNALERCCTRFRRKALSYHSQRNHFSRWLTARTEFAVAQKLRPRKVSDLPSLEALRQDLIESITEYRRGAERVSDRGLQRGDLQGGGQFFSSDRRGSLGGKARGLAFVRHLLYKRQFSRRFPGVKIGVPAALVLARMSLTDFWRRTICWILRFTARMTRRSRGGSWRRRCRRICRTIWRRS